MYIYCLQIIQKEHQIDISNIL